MKKRIVHQITAKISYKNGSKLSDKEMIENDLKEFFLADLKDKYYEFLELYLLLIISDNELQKFCSDFKQKDRFKILIAGDYRSENQTYHIRYRKVITESPNTCAGVGHISGVIELDKKNLIEYNNPDLIHLLILWCVLKKEIVDLKIMEAEESDIFADKIAIEYCLSVGINKDSIMVGYAKLLAHVKRKKSIQKRMELIKDIYNEKK